MMAVLLLFILLFVTGTAVGSFVNVMISRSIAGEKWATGRSKCDYCGRTLQWFDLFPIFSYLAYGGKSRCCRKPLSLQHPIVELMFGTLFVWWYFVGSIFFRLMTHPLSIIQPGYWLMIGLILLIIGLTDLFYGLIPTLLVTVGVVMTIIYRLILATAGIYQWSDLGLSLIAAIGAWAFFYSLYIATNKQGMGDGDVVLAFLLGLILGWPKMVVGVLASFVIGAIISLGLIAASKKKMKSTVPFGPFMIAGMVFALIYGNQMLVWMGIY